jgi:hypothetical protein
MYTRRLDRLNTSTYLALVLWFVKSTPLLARLALLWRTELLLIMIATSALGAAKSGYDVTVSAGLRRSVLDDLLVADFACRFLG